MNSVLRLGTFLLILCCCLSTVLAAESNGNDSSSKISAASVEPLVKQRNSLRTAGFDALYNVEYNQAEKLFAQISQLDPEHPSGYIYQAASIWLRQIHTSRRLHTALFNNNNMQGDITSGAQPIDEKLDKQFRGLIETARLKAEALIKVNPRDAEAHYFLGASYATLAGYEATVADKSMAAMRAGSKAVEIHRKVLKLDPNFIDAYLSIGVYDYIVANLPLGVRMMGSLFGMRGNESRGIAAIERVVKEGKYASDDARAVLVTIYQREKRYDEALNVLKDLEQRYPRNYLFSLEQAALLVRIDRRNEAFQSFEQLLSCDDKKQTADLIRFHYGDALMASGRYQEASEQFLNSIKTVDCDKQISTLAHFRAAQAYDLAKNRERAIEQYKAALSGENTFNIHNRAKEYLKKPFTKD